MKKRTDIFGLILGLVFLISGFAKSFNVAAFSDIIASYGFAEISFLAVPIVIVEIIIGLLFIFRIGVKITSLTTAIVLVFFTLIYSYGLIFKGIEDCGCFGGIKALNTSPLLLYIRNVVLLILAIDVFRFSENSWKTKPAEIIAVIVILTIASYISGYTSINFFKNKAQKFEKYEANESVLGKFATFSNDSTYLVFAFSYSCPHCMNSIANLEMYEKTGIVNKVIALAYDNDTTAKQNFEDYFNPTFEIKDYTKDSIFTLTHSFPRIYYIKNDTVTLEFSGELPSGIIFKSFLENIN